MGKQRILFLDLARGMAIFFMIMQHAFIIYAVDEGHGSFLGDTFVLLGTGPAAPVFMFIMGVFFLGARDMGAVRLRGLKLIGMGYLLNFFRFTLPSLLAGEWPASGPSSPLAQFLAIDILQMAGLSLILMGSLGKMKPWRWLAVSLGIALVSPLLWRHAPHNYALDILWGNHENVAFPFFPWCIYPLAGMYWGRCLQRAEQLPSFLNGSAWIGTGFMAVGGLVWLLVDTTWLPVGDYSRSGAQVHLFILGFVLVWFRLFYALGNRVGGSWFETLMVFWSRHTTTIYVIQWILVGWGMLVLGYQEQSPLTAFLAGLALILVTHVAVWKMKGGNALKRGVSA